MTFLDKFGRLGECYLLEKHRIDSFKSWPFKETSSCSRIKMAEAGFYWTGTKHEPDTATCFACGKTLDGWESTDEPWKEHAKHAPQCVFVKYGRPENELTVREFLDIFGIVIKNKITRDTEKAKSNLQSYSTRELEKFIEKET